MRYLCATSATNTIRLVTKLLSKVNGKIVNNARIRFYNFRNQYSSVRLIPRVFYNATFEFDDQFRINVLYKKKIRMIGMAAYIYLFIYLSIL